MFYYFDPLYFIMLIPAIIIAGWAQFKVKAAVSKYSKIKNSRGLTGRETAEAILNSYGINGVKIERISGFLSDHYDPRKRVLRLSPAVYDGTSITAMGIAAHEVGHAIQHAEQYSPLILRQTIAPVAMFGSNLAMLFIFGGIILSYFGTYMRWMIMLGVILFAIGVVFSLITLPVEFNASSRALKALPRLGIATVKEQVMVKKVLSAAALTYVAAAIAAILQLLYFLIRLGLIGGRD